MKVLYVADYQGPDVVMKRRIRRNRALGGSTKIAAFARSLATLGHEVSILSQGIPAERNGRFYGGFRAELESGHGVVGSVRVAYMPAVDIPVLNRMVGAWSLARWLDRATTQWDVALVYNLAAAQMKIAARLQRRGIPVVFEYEDDAMATLEGGHGANASGAAAVSMARRMGRGAVSVNAELAKQLGIRNAATIHGVVPDNAWAVQPRHWSRDEPLRLLYAGGLTVPKGIDLLVAAVDRVRIPWTLTITGAGPLSATAGALAARDRRVRFLGEVARGALESEMAAAHVCVNPHRVDGNQVGTLFPFKIAEYLGYGARVVSSRLGRVPHPIASGVLIYDGDDPGTLARAVERVAAEYEERERGLITARAYVKAHLSERAAGVELERVLRGAIA